MDRVVRLLFSAAFFLLFAGAGTLQAMEKPKHLELPDYDKRPKDKPVSPIKTAAAGRLKGRLPALQVDFDPVLRTPKSIVARDGFLSGPRGLGRGIAPQVADALPDNEPLHPLKAFLKEHSELFGHDERPLERAKLKKSDVGKHNGLHSYVFQ